MGYEMAVINALFCMISGLLSYIIGYHLGEAIAVRRIAKVLERLKDALSKNIVD